MFTKHALQRHVERSIDIQDVLHVLSHGRHEKKKTIFDEVHFTWKYAVRGLTLDNEDLRVIVAFDEEINMIIITVMEVI